LSLANQMRSSVPSLIAITGFLVILCFPSNAYSDFVSSDAYLVQATGFVAGTQNIFDSTFDIQLTAGAQSGSSILSTLDNGLVTINGDNYLNSGNWTTTLLRDGKFLLLQGSAQDQSGNTIKINLFGRQIQSNPEGVVYSISGKIMGSETFRVIYSAKIISAGTYTPPVTSPTSQTTPTPQQNQTQSNVVRISIVAGASNPANQLFFSPSVVNVAPGTTIIWTNNDSVPHSIMSGVASVIGGNASAPIFTSDGMINSGTIAPGKSFQYTITNFNPKALLSSAEAQYLNLPADQTTGDITFFDPSYTWMVGVISPISVSTPTQTVQINILPGASTATTNQYTSPSSVQVTPGSTIVLVNQDSVLHRILSGQRQSITASTTGKPGGVVAPAFVPDGKIDTGNIAPGQSVKITVSGTGVFSLYDTSNMWINTNVLSVSQISSVPPVQVSILPGSATAQGSASQQNQNYVNGYYSPDQIQIVPGTTIIWTNNDSVAHSIWSGTATYRPVNPYIPDGIIKSGSIAPGQTFQVVINSTGITRFYDPSYLWMNGMIVSLPPTQTHTLNSATYTGPTPVLH
jgi:plastocyanin